MNFYKKSRITNHINQKYDEGVLNLMDLPNIVENIYNDAEILVVDYDTAASLQPIITGNDEVEPEPRARPQWPICYSLATLGWNCGHLFFTSCSNTFVKPDVAEVTRAYDETTV